MMLAQLERDAQTLRDEALIMNHALGDPRLAHPTDPQVVAERRELQQLFDVQSGRANLLWEFVMRERAALIRTGSGIGNASGYARFPTREPRAETTPAFGMPPPLRGNDLTDKAGLDDWHKAVTVQVRASEHQMARALLPVSNTCR
jgi:hypothetical protein